MIDFINTFKDVFSFLISMLVIACLLLCVIYICIVAYNKIKKYIVDKFGYGDITNLFTFVIVCVFMCFIMSLFISSVDYIAKRHRDTNKAINDGHIEVEVIDKLWVI